MQNRRQVEDAEEEKPPTFEFVRSFSPIAASSPSPPLMDGEYSATRRYVASYAKSKDRRVKRRYFTGTLWALGLTQAGHLFSALCVTPFARISYIIRHSEVLVEEGLLIQKVDNMAAAFRWARASGGLWHGSLLRGFLSGLADGAELAVAFGLSLVLPRLGRDTVPPLLTRLLINVGEQAQSQAVAVVQENTSLLTGLRLEEGKTKGETLKAAWTGLEWQMWAFDWGYHYLVHSPAISFLTSLLEYNFFRFLTSTSIARQLTIVGISLLNEAIAYPRRLAFERHHLYLLMHQDMPATPPSQFDILVELLSHKSAAKLYQGFGAHLVETFVDSLSARLWKATSLFIFQYI